MKSCTKEKCIKSDSNICCLDCDNFCPKCCCDEIRGYRSEQPNDQDLAWFQCEYQEEAKDEYMD